MPENMEMLEKVSGIKVCHMSSVHKRYDQRILYRECVSLHDAGYDVTFLVNDTLEDEVFKGVKIKSTKKTYTGNRLRRAIFGVREIYKLAKIEAADIYHFHDPELMLIAKKIKKLGKIVVFDSHESYYHQIRIKGYLPKVLRKIISKVYKVYETYIVKRIDGVVFPVKSNLVDFESSAKRVVYLNNVPRMDELPKTQEKETEKEGVCYVGKLTYNRGISYLAGAARIAKVPLYLAGEFESKEFQDKVMKGNEDNLIRYQGFLNREEVYQLCRHCAIGASTLLRVGQYAFGENLSTKVYEYMAMEMPVILSDVPCNRRAVEQYGIGVLVDPADASDIADKIKYLLEHPDEMKKMGSNGKQVVNAEWNWSKEEEKLLDFYKRISFGEKK